MMADPKMQDPAAAAPEAQDGAKGYEICITVSPDGKISVGVESGDYEAAEEVDAAAQGAPSAPAAMPVPSIRAAMEMAMEIYAADGVMPDANKDAEFDAGFGPKGKRPMVDKMSMEGE